MGTRRGFTVVVLFCEVLFSVVRNVSASLCDVVLDGSYTMPMCMVLVSFSNPRMYFRAPMIICVSLADTVSAFPWLILPGA